MIHYTAITDLQARLCAGDITSVELVEHFIERYHRLNDSLHAIITLAADQALDTAAQIDAQRRDQQPIGPLGGIPLTVKDVIPTRGILTTYNSHIKPNWIPKSEPLAITRLREAGAIILGKANTNEFLGIPSDSDRFPRPRSPYNPAYVSIGSSSGPGVATAAGLCAAAIGTDGAGSVRLPAGQHGLVGLKATNGVISRAGMGRRSTLQVIGALTRTVADTALLYDVLRGHQGPSSTVTQLETGGSRWRIGVPWRYIETAPVEPEIMDAFRQSLRDMEALGAEVVDMRVSGLAEGRMATFVVLYTEHHASHAAALAENYTGYGESARLYAMQGAFISALDYMNALEFGHRLQAIVDTALETVDIIATPTSPYVTAEAARKPSEHRQGYNTIFTGPFNLTGHPAINVMGGLSALGIPIGLQFVGRRNDELRLLQISQVYQQATHWHTLHPDL